MDSKEHFSLWTRDFIFTTFANLFLFFSFQMLIPTLPVFTEQLGGDEFDVGLVIGIFTISALIIRPFAGKALDTLSKRMILFVGLLIFILSVLGYHLVTTVFLILVLRFIHGIGWGITSTAFGTIVSDIVPAKRRGEGMGYYGLSSTLGMAIAPLIGIWLMINQGFSTLFYVSSLLAVVSLLFIQIISFSPSKETEKKTDEAFWNNLFEKKALFPSLLVMLFAVTYGGIVSFITLFGKEVNIDNVGWFFLANALMVMVSRPLAGVLFDRKGHLWVLIPGALFAITGLTILSFTTNLLFLIISALFYGLGFGTIQPALLAWTINRVAPSRRGAANATFYSAFDLGIGLGSMILGIIAKLTSYGMMYRISIALLLLYLVLYLYYLEKDKVISIRS